MRCTFSATLTSWNYDENARTSSRASRGGRPRTRTASASPAPLVPLRQRMAVSRSWSTSCQQLLATLLAQHLAHELRERMDVLPQRVCRAGKVMSS